MDRKNETHRNYEVQEFIFDDDSKRNVEEYVNKYRSSFVGKTDREYVVRDWSMEIVGIPLFEELKYFYNNDVCLSCAICLSIMGTNKYNLRTYAYYYENAVHRIEAVWEYAHILLAQILDLELVVGKDIQDTNIKYRSGTWDFVENENGYTPIFQPYKGKKLEEAIEVAKEDNILLNISTKKKKSIFHKVLKKKISINERVGKIQELYYSEEACEMHRIRNEMVHRRPLGAMFSVGPSMIGLGQSICIDSKGWFDFKEKDVLLEKNISIVREAIQTIQDIIVNHDIPNMKENEGETYFLANCSCPLCGDNISVPRDVYDYLQDKAKKVPCPNCWKKGLIKNEDIQVNDKYYNQMLWEYSEEIIKRWDAIFGEV